jgi:hypothetical protein
MRRKSPKSLQKIAKRAKKAARKIAKKIPHLISDNNPAYLKDKEKLLKLLKGNKPNVPELFYEVEEYLKSKKKRDQVFKWCTDLVNGRVKKADVIYFINYKGKKNTVKTRGWWPYKK